jgi:hypothetical protein
VNGCSSSTPGVSSPIGTLSRYVSTMLYLTLRVRLALYAGYLSLTTDSFPCCRRIRKAIPCVISSSGTKTVGMK